jgi:hypothetical protein
MQSGCAAVSTAQQHALCEHLTDTGSLAALQSYKYNAPLLGALGAVVTPASYSQTGATVSFTLQRASGMTQLNLGANTQFVNTNLVTMEVIHESTLDPMPACMIVANVKE